MQPWGISGPQFLLYYVVAVLGGLVVADYARRWAKRTPPIDQQSTVDFAEAAFAARGTDRVVDAAVARLVHSRQLRVSRKGVLSAPGDPTSDHPIDRDVHQALGHRSMQVYALRKRIKAMPEVRAFAERVTSGRRARSPRARALAKYASLALLCLVVAVGLARLVNGIAGGLPVGYLFVLILVSMAIIPAFYIVVWPLRARTPRNDPVLARARDQLDGVDQVAALGMAAYPDEELRATLVASATPPKRKGAQQHGAYYSYGASASSSDSSGGGGCGGGNP